MTALGLHCCAGVTDAFLDCVAALCPDFEYLSLYHCAHNTDHCLAAMAQCPSLKAVICSPVCGGIAAGTWRNLTRSCTNLSRLFLSSCDSVGPVGPALELPKLRSISLFSCGLTYEALHSAAARGRTVTQISLAYNKEVRLATPIGLCTRAVLKKSDSLFFPGPWTALKDTTNRQPPPTANRQPPPTANRQPPTFEVEKVP